MRIYFAPMEGITNHFFRQAYDRNIGGIDRYYSPFVTLRDGGIMKKREMRDILPENNSEMDLIPQILTNSAGDFCQAARHMEDLGYREVNLNLGCPSGTVVPKGKGAGFLRRTEELDRFLEEIFTHCPIAVSVKSRIGFYDPEEFAALLDIFNQYPVKELILHLRTREEFYGGKVHEEVFSYAMEHSRIPLCYNGDVCTAEDVERLSEKYPVLDSVMIGRGFLMHPGFVKSQGGKGDNGDSACAGGFRKEMSRQDVHRFLAELELAYEEEMSGDTPVIYKMKEIWSYLWQSIPDGERWFKKLKKVKHLSDYKLLVEQIYSGDDPLIFG